MIFKLKLETVDGSTVAILPDEPLQRLKAKAGNSICAIETSHGFFLTQYDAEVEKQFRLGLKIMAERAEVFRALAD